MPQPTAPRAGPPGVRSGGHVPAGLISVMAGVLRAMRILPRRDHPDAAEYELLAADEHKSDDSRTLRGKMAPMAGKKLYRVINLVAGLAIFL